MKDILRKVYHFLLRCIQILNWKKEASCERKSITANTNIQNSLKGKKLILIPHADDEWVGCSRFVMHDNDLTLCNMDMQGGDSKQMHEIRVNELGRIASRYNRNLVTIGEDKDGELSKLITSLRPDIIFVPFFMDWHEEHVAVMQCLKTALEAYQDVLKNSKLQIAMYQVSLPIVTDAVTHCVPLDKNQWKEKWTVFEEIYKTQVVIPYKRFAYNEHINGKIASSFAAEVFVVSDAQKWQHDYEKMLFTEDEKTRINAALQNITETRKLLKDFYYLRTI